MRKIESPPDYQKVLSKKWKGKRILELIQNAEFNKFVNEVNEHYYYWDKVKYLKVPEGITNEAIWAIAKIRRKNTPFKIQIGKYKFSWFLNIHIQ